MAASSSFIHTIAPSRAETSLPELKVMLPIVPMESSSSTKNLSIIEYGSSMGVGRQCTKADQHPLPHQMASQSSPLFPTTEYFDMQDQGLHQLNSEHRMLFPSIFEPGIDISAFEICNAQC